MPILSKSGKKAGSGSIVVGGPQPVQGGAKYVATHWQFEFTHP